MQKTIDLTMKSSLCAIALLASSGCDALVNGSNAAASVTGKAVNDAASTWGDVFTYHGQPKPQLPQTRYCYKMMTDIVCYDSLQPTMTAQLIGYQDGIHQSWIQPGGGSLGASGGTPVAYQQVDPKVTNSTTVISAKVPIEATPVGMPATNGEIQTLDLPAR